MKDTEVLTPSIVLLELSYKADKEKWNFKKYLDYIKFNSEIAEINEKFVLTFGRLYDKVKKQIKDIGFVDVIILHAAMMNGARVLTGDLIIL